MGENTGTRGRPTAAVGWLDLGSPPVDLRFSNVRHPRLQIWRLRWPATAELRRAGWSPEVFGVVLDAKASVAAEVTPELLL